MVLRILRTAFCALAAACLLGLLGGCSGGSSAGSIAIDGSSTVQLISEVAAERFASDVRPGAKLSVKVSGTSGGFQRFVRGETDISNASRQIKAEEIKAAAENGVEYIELVVAYDGLSVVLNPQNDWCECLTVEQLRRIWHPDSTVQNWSDIDPAWPNEEILLYGPGADSGTFDYFTAEICGAEGLSREDYQASENDNTLVIGVQEDEHAMGYFGYAYYAKNSDRLRLLAVDPGDGTCVAPSPETIRNNTYKPLSRPLFIYVNKESLKRPEVAAFAQYYLDNAATFSEEVGYVAVDQETAAQSQSTLQEALAAE